MGKQLSKAEQRILGFLLASGGNSFSGSTAREIMEGTGLGHNTVYVALRDRNNEPGIPGVMYCKYHTNTGATMYYATPESIKDTVDTILTAAKQTIYDSAEWGNVPDYIFSALSATVDDKMASTTRLVELTKTANALDPDAKDYYYHWAVIGQAIAILALRLAKEA